MIKSNYTKAMFLKYYPKDLRFGIDNEPKTFLPLKDYCRKWKIKPAIIQHLIDEGEISKRIPGWTPREIPKEDKEDYEVLVWDYFGGDLLLNEDITPPLVKTSQYAKVWGITRQSIYRFVKNGCLNVSFKEKLEEGGERNYFDPWQEPPIKYKTKGYREALKRKRGRR